jgi:hypothetical protein
MGSVARASSSATRCKATRSSCAWLRRSHLCQRLQQNSELTHNFNPSFQKKWPRIKIAIENHMSCKEIAKTCGHSHALRKICRKADSMRREYAGRESWPEAAFSSFGHTSRAAASRSKRIARQNDVSYNMSRGTIARLEPCTRPFSTSLRARKMRKALRHRIRGGRQLRPFWRLALCIKRSFARGRHRDRC